MHIIDAHIHTSFDHSPTAALAKEQGIDFSWEGLQKELRENNIETAIAITTDTTTPTPGEAKLLLDQAARDPRLKIVCSINPKNTNLSDVTATEKLFKTGKIIGTKIFPGYHPISPANKVYHPFYELAGKYQKPVIIHTGDTFGSNHLIKYAHPLEVDEIAVKFPKTTFIIAHLGNPWVRDAAEVVYKNDNVYADLSAFCIGCHPKLKHYIKDDIRYALDYTGRPNKFLYGSDWPLVSMTDYINIIRQAVPKEHHKKVFYENAKRVFRL
jgi:predicted TIM-barrel fold metal-dependent hydrolase